jgi:uncharacterized protein YuzE
MRDREVPVRITLDDEADAAYIYLADEPRLGWRHGKTISIAPNEIGGEVNIDLDDDGRIVGIEVLDAKALLSDKVIKALVSD